MSRKVVSGVITVVTAIRSAKGPMRSGRVVQRLDHGVQKSDYGDYNDNAKRWLERRSCNVVPRVTRRLVLKRKELQFSRS